MSSSLVIDVIDLEGTRALGLQLGHALFPGAVVALVGQLGAGKTHLVKAIAEGLDIPDAAVVNSPTFVLIQEYETRLPLYHFDAYRLSGEAEFAELGADEYFRGDGVSIVEWADRIPGCLPRERLEIHIRVTGEHSRRFTLSAYGTRYSELLRRITS